MFIQDDVTYPASGAGNQKQSGGAGSWRRCMPVLALAFGAAFATGASAELFSRAGGTMVYDSDLNVTWLADANYAATQYAETCGKVGTVDGRMTWTEASRWAASLDVGGYHDWRLPSTPPADASCDEKDPIGTYGFHCVGGEMQHLFYGEDKHGLGGKAGENLVTTHNGNFDLFRNIGMYGVYWTGTEFAPLRQIALNFHTREGFSNANSKSVHVLAWAVRDGDVGTSDDDGADKKTAVKPLPHCDK